jgi:hypothetical protein
VATKADIEAHNPHREVAYQISTRGATMKRRGLGKGKGSGYKNLIPKDPGVHSQSSRGIKQPQLLPAYISPFKTPGRRRFTELSGRNFQGKIFETGNNNLVSKVVLPYNSNKFHVFSDNLVVINGQLFETEEDLKRMPKMVTIKFDEPMVDSDGDGMPDFMDCDPNDRTRQDDMPVVEIDDFAESLVPSGIAPSSIPTPEFEDIDDFVEDIELSSKIPEIKIENVPKTADTPEERQVFRQKNRVREVERQINSSKDDTEYEELVGELKKERNELRKEQEKETKIGLKDFSEKQLKELAVRDMGDEGFFASLFMTKNKYEKELIRRIQAKKRLDKDLEKAVREPVKESILSGLFKF